MTSLQARLLIVLTVSIKKLIAGNWKMFQTPSQAEKLSKDLLSLFKSPRNCDILLCPPYVSLERVGSIITGSPIQLGAQDLHWEKQSARTGKISGDMLTDIGVSHVILGHSEQRAYFHEDNASVNKKLEAALACALIPIVCVGESLEQREGEQVEEVISTQIREAFKNIPAEGALKCVIAYEPLWAIGTGKTASPKQAQEVHAFIRKLLGALYSPSQAATLPILYGGSVKGENAAALFACADIDGALVGGASLKAAEFSAIVEAAHTLSQS